MERDMRKQKNAAAVALLAVLVLAGGALAARQTSSLSLVVLESSKATTAPATEPSYGDRITFDVTTTETHPSVNVRCFQDGAWVYDGWANFWGTLSRDFTLTSNYWTGGAANCTARLLHFDRQGRERTLASMDFLVSA